MLWIKFWSTLSAVDVVIFTHFQSVLNDLLSFFFCLFTLIEDKVTAQYFIYILFLPIATLPVLLLNALRYTLPYRHRHRRRRRRSRGLSLSIYYARRRSNTRLNLIHPTLNWETLPTKPIQRALYSSLNIHQFLSNIDVLAHYHQFTDPFLSTLPRHFKSLPSTSLQHQRILLEAANLSTTLNNYGSYLPFCEPLVFTSTIVGELPIVIDTGASNSITPVLTDFTDSLSTPNISSLGSLTSAKTPVTGQGPIAWNIEDANGVRSTINTTAYYVPTATIRLFSPQVYTAANPTANLHLDHRGLSLKLATNVTVHFPIQSNNNLPFMLTEQALRERRRSTKSAHVVTTDLFTNICTFFLTSTLDNFRASIIDATTASALLVPVDDAIFQKSNWNLDPAQKELLRWHYRLGHINMPRVQQLLRKQPATSSSTPTVVPVKERIIEPINNKCATINPPLCAACQFSRQKRRTPPSHTTTKPIEAGGASDNIVKPGQRVSTDLYSSTVRGRLPDTFGREQPDRQYSAGAIFVDLASKFVFCSHQISTTVGETLISKHRFEAFSSSVGVNIKQYLADNHPFRSKEWSNDCSNQHQTTILSGVGAHHQNPSERYQQTIFGMARTMMIHFAMHWPQQAATNLWPFAVDHAVYLWNHIPNLDTAVAPIDVFTELLHFGHRDLQRLHVFGCPVYVLDPKLQDGKKLPKWERRSRRAIYLGNSKDHGSTVSLVLNIETGKVSPQYHLVFDDDFSTIHSDGRFDQDVWNSFLCSNPPERHRDCPNDGTPTLDDNPVPPTTSEMNTDVQRLFDSVNPPATSPSTETDDDPFPTNTLPDLPSVLEGDPSSSEGVASSTEGDAVPSSPLPSVLEGESETDAPALRRGTRVRRVIQRMDLYNPTHIYRRIFHNAPAPSGSNQYIYHNDDQPSKIPSEKVNQQFLSELGWSSLLTMCKSTQSTLGAFAAEHCQSLSYGNLVEYLNPALFITMANKEDNPTYKEAMSGPDVSGFIAAMEDEIEVLIRLNVFDVVLREPAMKVISGVWALRRKRYPDGRINKLKGRYCARGFEQREDVDYFETFSPVVMWLTVRLLLVMSILLNLETTQIDYTAAFVHAPIDCLVYVEMPKGFTLNGYVWKLNKSIYGLKQSPRNFFLYNKEKLESMGFQQAQADPCLFVSSDIICLTYVDDNLYFFKNKNAMLRLKQQMENHKMLFREEESVAGYLGVHIDRRDDGTIHLTQKGLIQKIIDALHLNNKVFTPAEVPSKGHLAIDKEGELAHGDFNYASVNGQLNYLQGHSRPDLCHAVAQTSRYVHAPRRSHELALIRIGSYLKGTHDKGIILRPNKEGIFVTNIYVDANFAGGWGTELGTNPDSVKSRTGYIIDVANVPILWISRMQGGIACSTMEAEYTALSMSLRAAIPFLDLLKEVATGLNYTKSRQLTFAATVHEDNQGALILARLEPGRHTPRSKYYALKLHWFRSWLLPKKINIKFVDTLNQRADFLTKTLSPVLFKRNRFLSMGW